MRFKKRHDGSAAASLRPTLYGALPIDQWPSADSPDRDPWIKFTTARVLWHNGDRESAVRLWEDIASDPGLEPRHNLQAWYLLRMAGVAPPPEKASEVLGVVAEVAGREACAAAHVQVGPSPLPSSDEGGSGLESRTSA